MLLTHWKGNSLLSLGIETLAIKVYYILLQLFLILDGTFLIFAYRLL